MSQSAAYQSAGVTVRDRTHTLFAKTMGYVALTTTLFAVGAYLGRDLVGGVGIVAFIAAFASLIGMQFAVRKSLNLAVGLPSAFGLLLELVSAPTLAYYANADPSALWQAGGVTALFIAGFSRGGLRHAARSDRGRTNRFLGSAGPDRVRHCADLRAGPGGALIYSVLGLVIFAALTMVDFQRLRRSTDISLAPLMAASIFLDILNVFQFFLQLL